MLDAVLHVPYIVREMPPRQERLEIRVEPDLLSWLSERAEETRTSVSGYLRDLIFEAKSDFEEHDHRPAETYVYFMRAGAYIKIGWTKNDVELRRQDLQTSSPEPIEILAYTPGDRALEMGLHKAFRHLHRRGEWFNVDDALLKLIAAVKAGTADLQPFRGGKKSIPPPERAVVSPPEALPLRLQLPLEHALAIDYDEMSPHLQWHAVSHSDEDSTCPFVTGRCLLPLWYSTPTKRKT